MANELTVSGSFKYSDGLQPELSIFLDSFISSITTKRPFRNTQNIGTTEEAIDLGDLTTFGYAVFVNLDPTNYLEIRSATGAGNDIIKLPARDGNNRCSFAIFHFGSDVTAPFAIANTAACNLLYILCPT
jgi:hypothetical protein